MRTYSGKYVDDNAAANGFVASVKEESFPVDEGLLALALNDEKKYYPDEVAATVADLDFAQEEFASDAVSPEAAASKYTSPTFAQKMLRADEIIQDRYDELKNYALRFKKLKTRISKKFDSINQGRLQFVKLSVAGKTLKLFLNMDIETIDPKFHCKDMRDKKTYVAVPVLLRVKSGRAVRYAKILIDQCAAQHGLKENPKFMEVDSIGMIEQFLYGGEEDVAETTDLTENADMPEIETAPEAADMPEVEAAPEVEDASEAADAPEVADMPEVEDAPEAENAPEVADMQEAGAEE